MQLLNNLVHIEKQLKNPHIIESSTHNLCLEIRIKVKLHNSIVFTLHSNYHRTQSDTIGQWFSGPVEKPEKTRIYCIVVLFFPVTGILLGTKRLKKVI